MFVAPWPFSAWAMDFIGLIAPKAYNIAKKLGFKNSRIHTIIWYFAPKVIPSTSNVTSKQFLWKIPTKMDD